MRFAWIDAERAHHSVAALCRLLGVTRQGYYQWRSRGPSTRERDDERLEKAVCRVHAESRGTYGSPRIHAALRDEGRRVSKRRIERAMRAHGLIARGKKRFRVTTVRDESHPVEPNRLDRDFRVDAPNRVWVGDITYIWTGEGWSYLAVVIDLFARRVVGWALDTDVSTALTLRALSMAITQRGCHEGLIFHSDRGCQYTSIEYRKACESAGIVQSMSRKGNCWDNAVAESFFATIKRELIHGTRWTNHQQLRPAVFEYIEVFYNRQRRHSTLRFQTPARTEHHYNAAVAA